MTRLQAAMATWEIPGAKAKAEARGQKAAVGSQKPVRAIVSRPPAPADWRARMKELVSALRQQSATDHGNDLWASL